ncbi:TIGR02391 family protein [Candidatus Poriferisodalis sp.]|uniref:TIGR02391 family protein n=1 Tax=Candidatus Poriferisodalis sp. TaxID=3101277 RepID=UPI003B02D014
MAPTQVDPFDADIIQGVADVLGETREGLTNSQIDQALAQTRIPNVSPGITKRHRIFNALAAHQNKNGNGKSLVALIHTTMASVRYRNEQALHARRIAELNEVLIYAGLAVNEEGRVIRLKGGAASTLDEAAQRAGSIRSELRRRGTHRRVLDYCTDELLQKNNFHAMLEASKSIPARLREMAGIQGDGASLADTTLSPGKGPLVAINDGVSETDRGEQAGFANLVKGILGMFRNPVAHDPRLHRKVTDDELVEAFTMMSMVHRHLDTARRAPAP